MSDRRVRVYTASKLDELPLWLRLVAEWPEVEFTARWVRGGVTYEVESTKSKELLTDEWGQNVEDVARSDVVMVYPPSKGALRGALVEVGIGIAMAKAILLVGDCPCYGTWRYHSLVSMVTDLESARQFLSASGRSLNVRYGS